MSIVFNEPIGIQGPHLDIQRIVDAHRNTIIKFKKNNASVEEIATFNLSLAHRALELVGHEIAFRQAASLVYSLHKFKNISQSLKEEMPSTLREMLESPNGVLQKLLLSTRPTYWPLNVEVQTQGELLQQLLALDFNDLLNPMRLDYLHFFHRLTMMGMLSPSKCGVFRTISVHVGDPNIFFPPPSLIPEMMAEFCNEFPTILPTTVKYDPILVAAEQSYKFVRIHPYVDGNGRVSRLIMNLVLWEHFPPVDLKADKKGRSRYGQALHRANRGDIKPLACLIAMSLSKIYDKLLNMLTPLQGS